MCISVSQTKAGVFLCVDFSCSLLNLLTFIRSSVFIFKNVG